MPILCVLLKNFLKLMQAPVLFYEKSFHWIVSASQSAHAPQIGEQVDDLVFFEFF
jgi:hypothetical protein